MVHVAVRCTAYLATVVRITTVPTFGVVHSENRLQMDEQCHGTRKSCVLQVQRNKMDPRWVKYAETVMDDLNRASVKTVSCVEKQCKLITDAQVNRAEQFWSSSGELQAHLPPQLPLQAVHEAPQPEDREGSGRWRSIHEHSRRRQTQDRHLGEVVDHTGSDRSCQPARQPTVPAADGYIEGVRFSAPQCHQSCIRVLRFPTGSSGAGEQHGHRQPCEIALHHTFTTVPDGQGNETGRLVVSDNVRSRSPTGSSLCTGQDERVQHWEEETVERSIRGRLQPFLGQHGGHWARCKCHVHGASSEDDDAPWQTGAVGQVQGRRGWCEQYQSDW